MNREAPQPYVWMLLGSFAAGMHASDYPVLSFERTLGEAAALDLPDEIRDAWLYGNANAFFFGGE